MEEPVPMEIVGISNHGKYVLLDVHDDEVAFDFFVKLLEFLERQEICIL